MSDKIKETQKKLADELKDLEHKMKDALEENEHFHTLEHQIEKRKPPQKSEDE